ncbi:MAG: paraquat-inducible protein A [Paracoccaceae bacterium]
MDGARGGAYSDGMERDLDRLICCPICDTLHARADLPAGGTARCVRCGTVLMRDRTGAVPAIVGLSAAAIVLMTIVVFQPFLTLQRGLFRAEASVFDTIFSVSGGWLLPLALGVAAFIVIVPLTRLSALIYALAPIMNGRRPARHAARALRLAERLRPWAMAEIFMIGCAVALVKLADLATVGLGPAFWAFGAVVLVVAAKERLMDRHSLWAALDAAQARAGAARAVPA